MSLAYQEHYTFEDYRCWDGDWELIEGMPYAMAPSPFYDHQHINGKIFRQLDEQLDDCRERGQRTGVRSCFNAL